MDIRLICRIVFPTLFPVILDTDSVICNESIMFFWKSAIYMVRIWANSKYLEIVIVQAVINMYFCIRKEQHYCL